ncbi:MAG: LysR family transcriptional regulator [Lachnospiraceae bacterium]|nr:LysR family transcriptional regulator [Lachnospiraceae bacterium]
MTYNFLSYFVKLAQLEHYTQASEALYISQPSLSYAIAKLEEELGVSLFMKNGRNVKLTQYGQIFYDHVAPALTQINSGVELLKQISTETPDIIHFAYLYILGHSLVPRLVNSFIELPRHSKYHFIFGQAHSRIIIEGIKNGTYDLGICAFVREEYDIEFVPIIRQRLILIVSPDHPLASRPQVSAKEALSYPLITYNSFTGESRRLVDEIISGANVKANIIYEFEEESSIAAMLEGSQAVAIVPEVSILDHSPVKRIPFSDIDQDRKLYLVKAKSKKLSKPSEAFYQFILNSDLTDNL